MAQVSPARPRYGAPASASEYTATERIPISASARRTRAATAPRFATTTLLNIPSVGRGPRPHQVLPHPARHAQLVDLQHPDQVVARVLGLDDGLRGEHGCEPPHVALLLDVGKLLLEAGLSGLDAMDDHRRE